MKKSLSFALAVFFTAGGFGASLARADDLGALASPPTAARLLVAPVHLPPIKAPHVDASAKSAPLATGAALSGNASTLVANLSGAAAIAPAATLMATPIDLKLIAPGDLAGAGFAPIQAAAAASPKNGNDILASRAAPAGPQLFLMPSSK